MCVAQVLETIGRMREAVEAYKDRVVLGGWTEEAFEAQMRVVSLMQSIPSIIESQTRVHI